MKISPARIVDSPRGDHLLRVEASVAYEGWLSRRETIWFDFPRQLEGQLSGSGDPWLTAMLPLAVALNEPVEVDMPIDARKLENAERTMEIWSEWYPWLRPVPIEATALPSPGYSQPRRVGCFFSGGVDSFFTVLHDREQTGGSIDDLIFIQGADIPVGDERSLQRALGSIRQLAEGWGMGFITPATNLRQTRFAEAHYDKLATGSLLGALGLLLEPRYQRLLISSTWAGEALHPLGNHPATDPLLSNSSTAFVHYGDEFDRIPKTEFVSRFPAVRENLRVCWEGQGADNCGECLKCLRTMTALEILGILDQTTTFRADELDLNLLRRQVFIREARYFRHLLPFALERGREDVAEAIEGAFERTKWVHRFLLFGLVPWAREHTRMRPTMRRSARSVYVLLRRLGGWLNRRLV